MAKPFSQRYGYVKVADVLQIDNINSNTRNAIWNCLYSLLFNYNRVEDEAYIVAQRVWCNILNKPLDDIPRYRSNHVNGSSMLNYVKELIMKHDWFRVYDLIEVAIEGTKDVYDYELSRYINHVFKEQGVGYGIIDGLVTPVSNSIEVESVQSAIDNNIESSKYHLQRALELLSDREQPDFRNSIKESISAIESLCRKITGDDKGTLGKLIKVVEEKGYIHQSMKNAFSSLYGYTSDEGGIRHSLTDAGENPTLEDARYMLVICSAFSNYLISKMGD